MKVCISLILCLLLMPRVSWADCTKDTDCKGERICERGQCAYPQESPPPEPREPEPEPERAPASQPWIEQQPEHPPAPDAHEASAQPEGQVAPEKKASWGGVGMTIAVVPVSRAYRMAKYYDSYHTLQPVHYQVRMKAGALLNFFGEVKLLSFLALGGELGFGFPTPSQYRYSSDDKRTWSGWRETSDPSADLLVWLMARVRFPLQVHRLVRVVPLVALGFCHYKAIDDENDFPGLGWALGVGGELDIHRLVKPMLELRYQGGMGYGTEVEKYEKDEVTYHAFTIGVGVKLF